MDDFDAGYDAGVEGERVAILEWLEREASQISRVAGDDLPLATVAAYTFGFAVRIRDGEHLAQGTSAHV
jgi:hypothetical protein